MIGILGATGEAGRALTRLLSCHGLPLRLGAPRVGTLEGSAHQVVHVDPADADALARFCAGCVIVVDCTGPARRAVADAVFAVGADLVTLAGDSAHERVRSCVPAGRRAVLSAGSLPGLAGLLPLLAVEGLGQVRRLQCLSGGLAPLCPETARLFLPGGPADDGEPFAERRNGRRRSCALSPVQGVALPCFPDGLSACPRLPAELDRTAASLGVPDARWYDVLPSGRADAVLARLWSPTAAADPADVLEELRTAVRLDAIGRAGYHRLVVQAESAAGASRTLVVGSADGREPAAVVTAAAVTALIDRRVPAGAHRAAEVVDPAELRAALLERPGITLTESADRLAVIEPPGWMRPRIAG
ncbi:hypothetical protein [Actinocorallia longicatena]|uniref:Saccharopine dehydrogenase NADP binding domain-containing protein n=1 Tax=Actinocorallia longicatena TaxID=111803 RepID=A0ABP6PXP6_9ACTN